MTLEVSTPALLFPAISLLFLAYTNRFLHLSALIRKLHDDWIITCDSLARLQIENLNNRLLLIRAMQLLGALSLLLCVCAMVSVVTNKNQIAMPTFGIALLLMAGSLICLVWEVWISGGALRILLSDMEQNSHKKTNKTKNAPQHPH